MWGGGWGLSPPSPSHQILSSLPLSLSLRQTPVPSLEVRAPCPYLECRCKPTAVAAAVGPCPTVAPARDLPAPLSLAPGRITGGRSERDKAERSLTELSFWACNLCICTGSHTQKSLVLSLMFCCHHLKFLIILFLNLCFTS